MRIFAATSRYIQGAGVLDQLAQHVKELGSHVVVVADPDVARLFGARIEKSFAEAKLDMTLLQFPGEVTVAAINGLCTQARAAAADVVIGVGGGKGIDTGKAVARALDCRFVSVPTIASNDAPASGAIAIYDDQHRMVDIQHLKRNPDLVLVDSAAIIAAPLRFLRAGIGDAISKKFEAVACAAAGAMTLLGAPPSPTGLMLADGCYRQLREHAVAGLRDAEAGQVTESVERVIEAAVLLSTLSFENAGLSVAHAIARGLLYLPRAAGTLHGDHVAYGLLVQLVLEHRDEAFYNDMVDFYQQVKLPWRLADFRLHNATAEEIVMLAEGSMVSPSVKRFAPPVTTDMLQHAIHEVERRSALLAR